MSINGPKIKISSDLIENLLTSQFKDAEYETDIDIQSFLYLTFLFTQFGAKCNTLSDIIENLYTC